ncbi:MAG: LysR family transcriptional regulator [Pelovirga sp.]
MTRLNIRSKVWLEIDGKPFLGGGRLRLLRAIAATGSINAAAQQLGISYRKAWSQLQEMEKHGILLVEREKGGCGGGQSTVTAQAHELLRKFDALQNGLNQIVDDRFAAIFAPEER